MNRSVNEASRWRIQLAGELADFYSAHPEVIMVCLGGSSSRGIADEWSDLDIVVYWRELDHDWIRNKPLPFPRTDIVCHASDTFTESYHFDGLKADFGHVRLSDWENWIKPVLEDPEPDTDMIPSIGGFLSSVVFHGTGEYHRIREYLSVYPDSLALHVVKKNLSFFVNGYLDGQCFHRGDIPAYHDGMMLMLKKLVNITAALNRYWYYAGEFRWLQFHLKNMPVHPEGLSWETVIWILENPGEEAVSMLNRFQDSALSLVAEQFPELRERVEKRRTRAHALTVRPCHERPSQSGI